MAEQKMEIRGITVYWSRKRIKNLYIKIKAPEARVMVSVPLHTSDRALADFIEEHWQWIEAKRQEVLSGAEAGGSEGQREYISGERYALWGEWYEMRVERSLKRPLTELRDREQLKNEGGNWICGTGSSWRKPCRRSRRAVRRG